MTKDEAMRMALDALMSAYYLEASMHELGKAIDALRTALAQPENLTQRKALTSDNISQMAKEAGWEMDDSCVLEPQVIWYISQEQLEHFAEFIEAKLKEKNETT